MKKNVFFRVDGNSKMGFGHIFRCIAIAEMLTPDFHCTFLIQEVNEELISKLNIDRHTIIQLPKELHLEKEAYYLIKNFISDNSIVVLDGYHFREEYQKILLGKLIKLISIDDIHSYHFYSHILINHASGISSTDYSCESYTRYYLGTDYALLRPVFLMAAEQDAVVKKGENIFINMGGSDPDNHTLKALKLCEDLEGIKTIEVVVGPGYCFNKELELYVNEQVANIIIHQNIGVQEMCDVMKRSQIGICSASTVAYEYCSIKGLLFLFKTASNQVDLYHFLTNNGLAFPFEKIKEVYKNQDKVQDVYNKQQLFFGGKSGKRILSIFLNLLIEDRIVIRKAEPQDISIYFQWVNDPEVRKNSINKGSILFENHAKWFNSKLIDSNSRLYIFSFNNELIGQVRLDKEGKDWWIGFSLDEKFRGKGFGEIILQKAMFELLNDLNTTLHFKARVQENNKPSENVFKKLGFKSEGQEYINSQVLYVFYKIIS